MLGRRTVAVSLTIVLLTTSCQARVEVAVDVRQGGAGTVTVSLGLDDDAMDEIGDLGEVLDVDDLVDRGWEIGDPDLRGDGFTWVPATREFGSPAEATAVLDEVSGPDGPFGSLTLARDRELLTTRYTLTGAVDLREGIEAFSDPALTEALGGPLAGLTDAELEAATTFRLAVTLPGDVRSNAPVPDAEPAVWELRLGERRPVTATAERFNRTTILAGVVAVGAVLALVVLLTVRALRRSP